MPLGVCGQALAEEAQSSKQSRTLNSMASERLGSRVDRIRNSVVLPADLDEPHCGLSGGPSSLEDICTTTRGRRRLGSANDECLGGYRRKSVNVGTEVDLDNIILGQSQGRERIRAGAASQFPLRRLTTGRLRRSQVVCSRERGKVCNTVVNRDRSWESKA